MVLTCCIGLLNELLTQYQMHLPASMELLWKLELLCPASVVPNNSLFHELPKELFSCSPDYLRLEGSHLP